MKEKFSKVLTVINTIFFGYAVIAFLVLFLPGFHRSAAISLFILTEFILCPVFLISYVIGAVISAERRQKMNIGFLIANILLLPVFYLALEMLLA